jgi:cytoskeletal protein CcmA (bactofilin family)
MFNKSNNPNDNQQRGGQTPFADPPSAPPQQQTGGGYRQGMEVVGSKPSIISEEVVLTGTIKTPGALHIEGTVNGDLEVASLTIGPTGTFEGNVNCNNLNIRGKFSGKSDCRELVVASSAVIDATITYNELTLQRGASLKGELHVAGQKN